MKYAGLNPRAWGRVLMLFIFMMPVLTGCQRSFVLRGSCGFNWLPGCENCDSCQPRIFPKHMSNYDCPTCGERGCTRKVCRGGAECTACGGLFPRLSRNFSLGCRDPRVPRGHHGKHHAAGHPYQPEDPLSPWSTKGPGSFHPVPTRPVYGPIPTPVDALPDSGESPSDPGLESLPLRDLPRNLDTPSDPRNLIPAPEELEVAPEDFPADASSSVLKKYPVRQTGWRPRTK